jgi:hypothetical protein
LTTIYIKYSTSKSAGSPVYAVVWVKTPKQFIVGLALPTDVAAPELVEPPPRMTYKGLTRYLIFNPGDNPPSAIDDWAQLAFNNIDSQRNTSK